MQAVTSYKIKVRARKESRFGADDTLVEWSPPTLVDGVVINAIQSIDVSQQEKSGEDADDAQLQQGVGGGG